MQWSRSDVVLLKRSNFLGTVYCTSRRYVDRISCTPVAREVWRIALYSNVQSLTMSNASRNRRTGNVRASRRYFHFLSSTSYFEYLRELELSRGLMCVISDANNTASARLVLDCIIAKERASLIRKYRNAPTPRWRHANGAALVCERPQSKKCGFIRIKPARQYGEPTRIRSSL